MTSTMTLEEAHTKGFELVQANTARFVDYISALGEADIAAAVPGSDWSAGEVITHVRSVYERYTTDSRRAPSAHEVGMQNGEDVERLGIDVPGAAESIDAQVAQLAAIVEHVAPDQTFPFHAGRQITLAGGWGNLLGELLAHGDDLARATGKPFGIPGEDLELLWRFTAPVLGGWLRADAATVSESWDLVFDFGTIGLDIADGAVQHRNAAGNGEARTLPIDDTALWTLTFPYRRRPLRDPAAALLVSRFQDL